MSACTPTTAAAPCDASSRKPTAPVRPSASPPSPLSEPHRHTAISVSGPLQLVRRRLTGHPGPAWREPRRVALLAAAGRAAPSRRPTGWDDLLVDHGGGDCPGAVRR